MPEVGPPREAVMPQWGPRGYRSRATVHITLEGGTVGVKFYVGYRRRGGSRGSNPAYPRVCKTTVDVYRV